MLLLDQNNEYDSYFGELYLKGYLSESMYLTGKRHYFRLTPSERETILCRKPQELPLKPGRLEKFAKNDNIIFFLISFLAGILFSKLLKFLSSWLQ